MTGIKDSGSNYNFYEKNIKANVEMATFDRSYINTITAKEGMLIPYHCKMTLPNQTTRKSVEMLAEVVNPPIVPLFSRQRVFMHEYWLSFTQLWKNAQIFFDKGKTLNQFETANNLRIPKIKLEKWKRGSLADYLNFNFVRADSYGFYECSALKFMAYLRVWRDMYCNKRIYAKWLETCIAGESTIPNPLYVASSATHGNENLTTTQITNIYNFLFPLDDGDFRLDTPQWNAIKDDTEVLQWLFGEVQYRDFVDDYFTSATLEPMFGNIPTVHGSILGDTLFEKVAGIGGESGKSNIDTFKNYLGWGTVNKTGGATSKQLGLFNEKFNVIDATTQGGGAFFGTSNNFTGKTLDLKIQHSTDHGQKGTLSEINDSNANYSDFIEAFNNTMRLKVKDLVTSFTIDQIRQCESATLLLEKLAKTDGSYSEFTNIMFGVEAKAGFEFKPRYIGGNYQPINYQQVINTAGGTQAIQGQITGNGTSYGKGNIGTFFADDFGVHIGILSIMPDTYYCQGLDREDSYETAEDFYLPDRAQLGKQAILQKELFNDPQNIDNDEPWGWIGRFDELRYCANQVHCELADENDESFKPYIQSRIFESAPTLTPSFLTTKGNIDNSWLSVDEDLMPPFIIQILNESYETKPLPYRNEPLEKDV